MTTSSDPEGEGATDDGAGGDDDEVTGPTVGEVNGDGDAPPPNDLDVMSFADVHARSSELVGTTVTTVARAFFISRCPPPAPDGPPGECVLVGFLADPSRRSLDSNEVDQALVLAEGHAQVSCAASSATSGACSGWEQARRYRVVATVEHQVLGGRETAYVQLDVAERTPLEG